MTFFDRIFGEKKGLTVVRTSPDPWAWSYSATSSQEQIPNDFDVYAQRFLTSSSVVWACVDNRMSPFSEGKFAFSEYTQDHRRGDLKHTEALAILDHPWPGATTSDLLARMELDVSACGNSYWVKRGDRLVRLRPNLVTVIIGVPGDPSDTMVNHPDARILAYSYRPGGGADEMFFQPEEVCHYKPKPDPAAHYRGMSWITPVIQEIESDKAATRHKLKYFEHGGSPRQAIVWEKDSDKETVERFMAKFKAEQTGVDNAYRTLVLGAGADIKSIGTDLRALDFTDIQGGGEVRIAAAAGVPPVIVGLKGGLENATYSNYSQARRRLADNTIRPLWRSAAGALATLIDVPKNMELWYDDRDIAFLREDLEAQAKINTEYAAQIKTFVDGGFTPESAVKAVTTGDLRNLEHTGLVSVQLLPPGAQQGEIGAGAQGLRGGEEEGGREGSRANTSVQTVNNNAAGRGKPKDGDGDGLVNE